MGYTTVVYDVQKQEVVRQFLSLTGTFEIVLEDQHRGTWLPVKRQLRVPEDPAGRIMDGVLKCLRQRASAQ